MKNKIYLAIAYSIFFALYNVLVFSFVEVKTTVFLYSYIFTIIAFLLQVGAFILLYHKKSRREGFLGLPLTIIGLIYLLVQIVASTIFMIMPEMSLKISNVIQSLIWGIYLIVSLVILIGKNGIHRLEKQTHEERLFIKITEDELLSLYEKTKDDAVKKQINKLCEMIRYSDPISHPSIILIEQKISQKISLLSADIECNNNDVFEKIEEIISLISERNRKCKLLKY